LIQVATVLTVERLIPFLPFALGALFAIFGVGGLRFNLRYVRRVEDFNRTARTVPGVITGQWIREVRTPSTAGRDWVQAVPSPVVEFVTEVGQPVSAQAGGPLGQPGDRVWVRYDPADPAAATLAPAASPWTPYRVGQVIAASAVLLTGLVIIAFAFLAY
jgi:hypothetical protein